MASPLDRPPRFGRILYKDDASGHRRVEVIDNHCFLW